MSEEVFEVSYYQPVNEFPLQITDGAQRNIINMFRRLIEISNEYGHRSEEHLQAQESLVLSLASMFRLGGYITAEDDLSLYGASFIHYGVIFHRKTMTWSVHS